MGAGLRGASDPFQTARELLQATGGGGFYPDTSGELPVTASSGATEVKDPVGRASQAGCTPKHLKMKEAAKTTPSISLYFGKRPPGTGEGPERGVDPGDVPTATGGPLAGAVPEIEGDDGNRSESVTMDTASVSDVVVIEEDEDNDVMEVPGMEWRDRLGGSADPEEENTAE